MEEELKTLCMSLFTRMKEASFANVLTIVDKIRLNSDEEGMYDLDYFCNALKETLNICIEQNILNSDSKEVKITEEFLKNILLEKVDKRKIIEHFLCELKIQAE